MSSRHKVLALLSFLSVITYLDRVCISVAGPKMQDTLHISPEGWGWVVGVFALAYGAFEIPSGTLGDRIGPHKVLTRIVLWWSAFTCLTGLVTSYPLLLLVRFCFGAGEAGAYPNSSAVVARWFPTVERAKAIGCIFMASQLGGALSPLLVLPLQDRFGWRASFFAFGLLGTLWAAAWWLWYRESSSPAPAAARAHHLPWHVILRDRNLRNVMMMSSSFAFAHFFFVSWLHTYLVKGRGFTGADLMLSTLPFLLGAVANAAGGFASDQAVRRWGKRRGRQMIGWTGVGTGMLFVTLTLLTPGKYLALVWLAFGCAGLNFVQPTIWAVCLDIGRQQAGAVSASMNTASQCGSFLSSVLFGYLVKYTGSYEWPLASLLVSLAISAAMWRRIDPDREIGAAIPPAPVHRDTASPHPMVDQFG